jgi:hypothetical protein
LDRYPIHQVGGRTILEYWIPAEDLAELNANIVGPIELVAEYHQDEPRQTKEETGRKVMNCNPNCNPGSC